WCGAAHSGRVHSGDEATRGFSTSLHGFFSIVAIRDGRSAAPPFDDDPLRPAHGVDGTDWREGVL
ncbi:hypothetical protein, partial [Rhodococcus opacus]|uniref:hypothetical protein n=1 Tax=Rhodococcus opacus TaxID=37919 RepID=UPI001ED95591